MINLPNKLTNRLRREPLELLEVVDAHFVRELGDGILAAFPVVQRQSLERTYGRILMIGAIAAVFIYIAV